MTMAKARYYKADGKKGQARELPEALFDGVVNHKVLRLHQIRYGVHLLPYDLPWNAFAVIVLAAGFFVLHRARSTPQPQ